jgi:hypothetical protein
MDIWSDTASKTYYCCRLRRLISRDVERLVQHDSLPMLPARIAVQSGTVTVVMDQTRNSMSVVAAVLSAAVPPRFLMYSLVKEGASDGAKCTLSRSTCPRSKL